MPAGAQIFCITLLKAPPEIGGQWLRVTLIERSPSPRGFPLKVDAFQGFIATPGYFKRGGPREVHDQITSRAERSQTDKSKPEGSTHGS
jgi:hypothetical protein